MGEENVPPSVNGDYGNKYGGVSACESVHAYTHLRNTSCVVESAISGREGSDALATNMRARVEGPQERV